MAPWLSEYKHYRYQQVYTGRCGDTAKHNTCPIQHFVASALRVVPLAMFFPTVVVLHGTLQKVAPSIAPGLLEGELRFAAACLRGLLVHLGDGKLAELVAEGQ